MSKEWGIYPENITPRQWWGARALIEHGQMTLLADRISYEKDDTVTDGEKSDMFCWMQNEMDAALKELIKAGKFRVWEDLLTMDSDDGRFHCEATPKNSGGGYLYIGCWQA